MVVSASSPIFFSWGLKNPLLRSFFPEMRDDEVLLLVQFDSRPEVPDRPLTQLEKSEGGRGFIPPLHTAAELPGSEGGASNKHAVRVFAQGWLLWAVVFGQGGRGCRWTSGWSACCRRTTLQRQAPAPRDCSQQRGCTRTLCCCKRVAKPSAFL